jgi:hypothetical protein
MLWTCVNLLPVAASGSCEFSPSGGAPTSKCSPATLRLLAAHTPPSPAGCQPSPGCTGKRSRKSCLTTPRLCMCGGHGSTASPTPPAWTATRSAALLVAEGLGTAAEHSLISLLALNGCVSRRPPEWTSRPSATNAGAGPWRITRKGGKKAVIPLAPRTARAIDLAIGERCEGPVFITQAGERLDRYGAGRIVRRVARRGTGQEDLSAHLPPCRPLAGRPY